MDRCTASSLTICVDNRRTSNYSWFPLKELEAMEPRATRKDERMDVRLDREAKMTISRAAALRQQSVSDFVLSTTLERAQEVIERANVIRLNEHEAERFLAALANPPAAAPRLREAAAKYQKALAKGRIQVR